MKKLFVIAAVVFGFAATSFAQTQPQATFTASVDLQKALHIEKVADLNFGTIYFPALGGDVTIAGTTAATISGTGFYELTGNTKSAAKFNYGGGQSTLGGHGYVFNIWTAPISLKNTSGATLSFMPEAGDYGIINGDRSEQFRYIGGTLTVPAGTAPGVYTSENMVVSIYQQ